jgi:hypothetical protein
VCLVEDGLAKPTPLRADDVPVAVINVGALERHLEAVLDRLFTLRNRLVYPKPRHLTAAAGYQLML